MLPLLLVMPAPAFKMIPPAPLPSLSLLSNTFSLFEVDVIDLLAATEMSPLALRLKLASVPAVLLMLSLTAMLAPLTRVKLPLGLPMVPMLTAPVTVKLPAPVASLRPMRVVAAEILPSSDWLKAKVLGALAQASAAVPPTLTKVPAVRLRTVTVPLVVLALTRELSARLMLSVVKVTWPAVELILLAPVKETPFRPPLVVAPPAVPVMEMLPLADSIKGAPVPDPAIHKPMLSPPEVLLLPPPVAVTVKFLVPETVILPPSTTATPAFKPPVVLPPVPSTLTSPPLEVTCAD